eukprot:5443312-Heterocapsa_arctica.AAC.1
MEVRHWRFSPADWNRLCGGSGHHIGIAWCDALKLASMCPDMNIFDEVMNIRDLGLGYLPDDLEARCRARIDAEIR